MKDIKYGDFFVATTGNISEIQQGKTFSTNPADPLQYGLFKLPLGEILQRHIHKSRPRLTPHKTMEFLYIVSGKMKVTFYTLEKLEFCYRVLSTGDFIMLFDGGHGFEVLQKDTVFIEVKSGQFVDTETDKEKF